MTAQFLQTQLFNPLSPEQECDPLEISIPSRQISQLRQKPDEQIMTLKPMGNQLILKRLQFLEPVVPDLQIFTLRVVSETIGDKAGQWVNIADLFDTTLLVRISKEKANAVALMDGNERAMYEAAPKVFDAITDELLRELLGTLSERTTSGLRNQLTEWLRLMVVRVSTAIEV